MSIYKIWSSYKISRFCLNVCRSLRYRSLARELAEYNIVVNAIAPGLIRTPFHNPEITPPQAFEKMASEILLKRAGAPEDIVGAAMFLASDYADYITGATIDVNGGLYMS
ncbi:SDR family NAD(P)-dependent oxidoreductase [Moorella stamsii]|uniref:SDR family NAD(P)-dependent oxidoreductase n=1 Tax=Neomoorella stamsii TaxID=1266720 RepID=UPI00241458DA|nr:MULTISPECIES: SDR family oxidoreductase [Moorella]